jgi:hypothetical protein
MLFAQDNESGKQHSIEKLYDCIICTDIANFHATNSHFHAAKVALIGYRIHHALGD